MTESLVAEIIAKVIIQSDQDSIIGPIIAEHCQKPLPLPWNGTAIMNCKLSVSYCHSFTMQNLRSIQLVAPSIHTANRSEGKYLTSQPSLMLHRVLLPTNTHITRKTYKMKICFGVEQSKNDKIPARVHSFAHSIYTYTLLLMITVL